MVKIGLFVLQEDFELFEPDFKYLLTCHKVKVFFSSLRSSNDF